MYWLLLIVGIIPVIVAVLNHATWGAVPTLGGLFCVFALRSLLVARLVHWRDRAKGRHSDSSRFQNGN